MITVSHLSKTFHNPDGTHLTVLKDINCEINAGEVVSIIGPSGTGKSTFLRALNLLDPPTGGSIIFDGEDVLAKGYPVHKMRQKMGMDFQSFNLFDHMTVLENVIYAPCKIKKEPLEKHGKRASRSFARWDWPKRPMSILPTFPADRSSVWPLPAAWLCIRRSSSLTNLLRLWTPLWWERS